MMMARTSGLAATILVGAILSPLVRSHFFWAATNESGDHVTVTFSESAGVPDKVIAIMESRVTTMSYTVGTDAPLDVPVSLNDEKTLMEGDLPRSLLRRDEKRADPALVSGYLDFGPFMKFHDLEYTFGAQLYSSEEDYDSFFRPQMRKAIRPSIVMRNCGGRAGTGYQFDVGGFPSEGPLGVCLYRKGGVQIGCGEFESSENSDVVKAVDNAVGRNRRHGEELNLNVDLLIDFSQTVVKQNQEAGSYLIYAIANKTITEKTSKDASIAFASTSVYFEGPCKAML